LKLPTATRRKDDQLEAFSTAFRAQATKAKQVPSRIKELERMEKMSPSGAKPFIFFPNLAQRTRLLSIDMGKSYGVKQVFGA